MSDKNKDGLEDFFRKGAQKYDLEFREEDWLKLSAMLDAAGRGAFTPWFRSFRWWIGSMFLIGIAVFGIWWFTNSNDVVRDNQSSILLDEDGSDQQAHEIEANRSKSDKGIPDFTNTLNEGNKNQGESNSALTKEGIHHNISDGGREELEGVGTRAVVKVDEDRSGQIGQSDVSALFADDLVPKLSTAMHPREKVVLIGPLAAVFNHPYNLVQIMPAVDIEKVSKAGEIENIIPDRRIEGWVYHPYVGISFAASPDFSSVGLTSIGETGSRVGFSVDYSLSRRLSINAGAIWTNNKYEAYGKDYKPPYGFWTNGIVPDETMGECKILDIPVNLRYNVVLRHRHMLFLSAGISSYIMLEEHYNYYYDQDDPDLIHYWGSEEPSAHLFGIANASVGYEFLLLDKLSLQVEPFIKLPLTGIGYGKVELNSLGSYFSLKYRLLR